LRLPASFRSASPRPLRPFYLLFSDFFVHRLNSRPIKICMVAPPPPLSSEKIFHGSLRPPPAAHHSSAFRFTFANLWRRENSSPSRCFFSWRSNTHSSTSFAPPSFFCTYTCLPFAGPILLSVFVVDRDFCVGTAKVHSPPTFAINQGLSHRL